MLLAQGVWVIAAFALIAIVIGIDVAGDIQQEGFLLNWNTGLDLTAMIGATASGAFCTVQLIRERRIHEEILRSVLESIPDEG